MPTLHFLVLLDSHPKSQNRDELLTPQLFMPLFTLGLAKCQICYPLPFDAFEMQLMIWPTC